jgi:hypothetical protein
MLLLSLVNTVNNLEYSLLVQTLKLFNKGQKKRFKQREKRSYLKLYDLWRRIEVVPLDTGEKRPLNHHGS